MATPTSAMPIRKLLMTVSRSMEQCPAIQGASTNSKGDKLEIDVIEGKEGEVCDFLHKKFPIEYEAGMFDVIEQATMASFLVGIGSKVANANIPAVTRFANDQPQNLRQHYGTVACLAKDVDDQTYVITSNHVIHHKQVPHERPIGAHQNEGSHRFISVHHNQLCDVSDSYQCFFGPRETADGDVFNIDIAALKLSPGFPGFYPDVCGCGFETMPDPFTADDIPTGLVVLKNGASTGITCGKVLKENHYIRFPNVRHANLDGVIDLRNESIARLYPGNGILVVSMEPKKPFAQSGDSGALVWDINSGKPVGMVSYQLQNYRHRNERTQKLEPIQATYVVRLNRCIEALESADDAASITKLRCQLHGCSVPKPPGVRQSTGSTAVDSVESVQS